MNDLRMALRSADASVRAAAAMRAGDDVVEDLAVDLRERLGDSDPGVRWAAARALSALHAFRGGDGDAEVAAAVVALKPLLADTEERVRRAAAAALGLIADSSAAPDLVRILDEPALTELAEEGLRRMGPQALPAAEDLALRVRRGEAGADAAARLLLELGPAALPVIGRLLDDPAADRVLAVLPALGVWAAPLLPELSKLAHGPRGAKAARVLVAIGPDAWPVLADLFDRGRPEARAAAVSALDLRAQPDLVGLAVRALFDDAPSVRLAALNALSGHPDAARPFVAEISLLRDDPDAAVVTAATSLLALL